MKHLTMVAATGAALMITTNGWAQQVLQTNWASGPGTTSSTNLTGEASFDTATGHALYGTVPGALRVVQVTWEDAAGVAEVMPVQVAQDPVTYYDHQGSGGTPTYPTPVCLESRFWMQRDTTNGALHWMFHVNVNGLAGDPCGGEIDATYAISPNNVATLILSDEAGESTLTGFTHYWINQWADGHIVTLSAPAFNVTGTIDRVLNVTRHDMFLDDQGASQGFVTTNNMTPEPWTIDADLAGRLESAIFDTGAVRDWGQIDAQLTAPQGTTVELYVRTGSSVANVQAQAWEGSYALGADLTSTANSGAQFIQYAVDVTLPDIATANPVPAEPVFQLNWLSIDFDTDGDGLDDDTEVNIGTDPNDADSDDDGVQDGDEPLYDQDTDGDGLINALDPDSDDDGLFDGTEMGLDCANPATDPSAGNCTPDGDSGTTTTDPLDPDSDGGGVSDGSEDGNLNGVVDSGETDPTAGNGGDDSGVTDTDGDGLSDILENHLGLDPNDADTDDDGLLDGDEHNPSCDTDGDGLINPLDVDSDNDALFDGLEEGLDCSHADTNVAAGHCTADGDSGNSTTYGLIADTDGGGAIDGSEDCNRNGVVDSGETDPNNLADDSTVVDTDNDGLSDCLENSIGSNPNDGDSDDDGVPDGMEPNPADDHDGDGQPNIIDPDSDDDGLFDGTEMGLDCSHPDTDANAGFCIPDGDNGATTTNPLDADTDDGGVSDGDEDVNHNGVVDSGETDPTEGNGGDDDPGGGQGGGGSGGEGGASSGTGGASSGTGGASSGTGGTSSGTGGASSGTGGTSSGTGGASSGTGGNAMDEGLFAQGGCACAVPGGSTDQRGALLALLAAAAVALGGLRRRSRPRRRR